MLDKSLGEALLKLDLSRQPEPPSAQVERIIDADRQRVKRWTRIAVALWVLAALGALMIACMGMVIFPIITKMITADGQAKAAKAAAKLADQDQISKLPVKTIESPNEPVVALAKMTAMCLVVGSASFLVLVLAGLATVLLLLRSRSATLRQINANLLLISEQLKCVPPGTAIGGA